MGGEEGMSGGGGRGGPCRRGGVLFGGWVKECMMLEQHLKSYETDGMGTMRPEYTTCWNSKDRSRKSIVFEEQIHIGQCVIWKPAKMDFCVTSCESTCHAR